MFSNLQPWHILLTALAGWINRHQRRIIDYLQEENRVLKEQLGHRRLRLTDDQRRRLAVKGKILGCKVLREVATIVTPDTIMTWHRKLIAMKWDYSARRRRASRPQVMREIEELAVRMAQENPRWGYTSIQGALANLGHGIARTTVANILKAHGIEPAPRRGKRTTWRTFLKAHWNNLAAADFFTVEVWTPRGLVTFYVLLVMELSTRRIHFAGATPNPNTAWMRQIGRTLTDAFDGFLRSKRFLIIDRDRKYCETFTHLLEESGTEIARLPPRSPNLNANAERVIRSIKEECLDRMMFFGEESLHRALPEYLAHYHGERNHQGLGNQLIQPDNGVGGSRGAIQCRERLGGILRYYYRQAA
jgi:transposase InsO family protein